MLLSVLIPAYNEERTIAAILDKVLLVDLSELGCELEVVVCDDGSSDRTAEIVERKAALDSRILLLRHGKNQGKGAGIRTALAAAHGDFVLVQDADLEYDPADYPALVRLALQGHDVVYGSRFHGGRRPTGMQTRHLVANRLLSWTANALFDLSITDEATCFKLFRTELLRSLQLECTGFEFCPEVTAKLGCKGVSVAEVPIRYSARPVSEGKKIRWTDGLQAMWVLVKYRVAATNWNGAEAQGALDSTRL